MSEHPSPPSFLCSSQESSRRASARREDSFQPKDLGWLDSCDKHRNEGSKEVRRHSKALFPTGNTPAGDPPHARNRE
ncbi:MAG: hypothetical protein DI595_18010 [Agrobacterium fabrum]|uniref:Uncharacterized protein n=1 Tax=Agrobacterium fabrum TaxID=1176649 RepID=A0A2W5GKF4_9HYPH|nr:MAG: hypothetical protein DI595_18010 [Agrobacterium fabrum]